MKSPSTQQARRTVPREWPRAFRPAFNVVETKLNTPQERRDTVPRIALMDRLRAGADSALVVLEAPPGYGKTTTLGQWGERDGRRFAWVTVDELDNDPIILLTYVAVALDRIAPIDARVFSALASLGDSAFGTAVPRLGAAVARMRDRFVLVLDDAQFLQSRESLDALEVITRHIPYGSQMAVAGRRQLGLRVPRLRAGGTTMELGPEDLRLNVDEARTLMSASRVEIPETELSDLVSLTEGWPAGLYLAVLHARDGKVQRRPMSTFKGDSRLVAEYLGSEVLAALPKRERDFLTRTAVLSRMTGPLCDAVLRKSRSAATLDALEAANLFVVPLDRNREWYRYHFLFRQLLRSELERREPQIVPDLLQRAADWCERNGRITDAVGYAQEAGDAERVADLFAKYALPIHMSGRAATVEAWFTWLAEQEPLTMRQDVLVLGAWVHALHGRSSEAERLADMAEEGSFDGPLSDGTPSIEPWVAMLRAILCRDGVAGMRTDAERAVAGLAPQSVFRPTALVLLGLSHLLEGDRDGADDIFADAANEAERVRAGNNASIALAERAALAMERGSWPEAASLSDRASSLMRDRDMGDYVTSFIVYAVAARVDLHRGKRVEARSNIARAQRLRPQLSYALAPFAVQARLELARALLAMADAAGARTLVREIDETLQMRRDLGALGEDVQRLRTQLATAGTHAAGASTLTSAELRLLPYLPLHFSFREIGDRLHVSQHTVKTQAISLYRKLGVTSRSAAISRARELGLLEE